MSVSYFAHAAYGVRLPAKDRKKLDKWAEAYLEDESEEEWEAFLERVAPDYVEELKKRYGAPEESHLVHTGDEDERPGRCNCDAGCWLLAIGYPAFPLQGPISEAFKAKASWFSWVSCS
jgi:hypothetical protein